MVCEEMSPNEPIKITFVVVIKIKNHESCSSGLFQRYDIIGLLTDCITGEETSPHSSHAKGYETRRWQSKYTVVFNPSNRR
jgi:hypothetical protein